MDRYHYANSEPPQLSLLDVPQPVLEGGLADMHPRPLVARTKRPGEAFTSFRVPANRAWEWDEVEYARTPTSYTALVVDLDGEGSRNRVCGAPVREFLSALREFGAPVLLVVHSTKAARGGNPDPFDPGMVAGSGAWTDGVRGVLTLSWGEVEGARVLACPKANHGPARLLCGLAPVRKGGDPHGRILAFQRATGGAGWHAPARKPKAAAAGTAKRKPKAGGDEYVPGVA